MLPTKFNPDRPLLPRQRNLRQKGLQFGFCKKYIQDLCVQWEVLGNRLLNVANLIPSQPILLPYECHMPQTVKIVIVKYQWPDISVTDQL